MAKHRVFSAGFVLLLACTSLNLWAKGPNKIAETTVDIDQVTLHPAGEFKSFNLVVTGPSGRFEYTFSGDETAVLDQFTPDGELLKDGLYNYEITAIPLRKLIDTNDGDRLPTGAQGLVQSGVFTILQGEFVLSNDENRQLDRVFGKAEAGGIIDDTDGGTLDQQILDDLIVDGSACIGQDCVNGESFGFDTLRLKENNLRIKAQDTSNTASFPSRDWQITFNDSGNGGADKFSIDDIDGGRTPFTIEAGARTDALFVEDSGQIGIGTSTPVADLHVKQGNTPTLRLEQDGSSGFTAQTWDLAGNEANIFIRDATNGSDLPFRIFPNAGTDALTIEGNTGDIGVGTKSPSAPLHVIRTNGTAQLFVQDLDPSVAERTLVKLEAGAGVGFSMANNTTGTTWTFFNSGGFLVDNGSPGAEMQIKDNGLIRFGEANNDFLTVGRAALNGIVTIENDLTVNGTFLNPSDVNLKEDFQMVDPNIVLEKLVDLPVTTWTYKKDDASIRHMGVIAQDFYDAFGLGSTDRYLTTIDPDGVAMAAIQGLNNKVEAKNTEIADLKAKNGELEERLARLEALVNKLTNQ